VPPFSGSSGPRRMRFLGERNFMHYLVYPDVMLKRVN
jgi:hypothetical protein